MPIKIGFSSSVCPGWDVKKIAEQASEMGFYGVELGAVRDEIHLPAAPDLQTDKDIDAVRKLFADASVEIAAIASIYALDSPKRHIRERSVTRTLENIELAEKLGCPVVRVPLGTPAGREPVEHCLARQVPHLAELARIAARKRVTLLLCNTAGFPSSRAVWFLVDAVALPSVQAAWNTVIGLACNEYASVSIPRLRARIRQVQMADAAFDAQGRFAGYRPLGKGNIECAHHIDLLKGVLFSGYLMLDWPQAQADGMPGPEESLPAALSLLLERIKHTEPELSAYKKDKYAPNLSAAQPAFVPRSVAKVGAGEAGGNGETAGDEGAGSGEVKPRVAKGGDPRIAALVAEAVKKARAARAAKEGK